MPTISHVSIDYLDGRAVPTLHDVTAYLTDGSIIEFEVYAVDVQDAEHIAAEQYPGCISIAFSR
jgi:hypothetical protein